MSASAIPVAAIPAAILTRRRLRDPDYPQFLSATILPSRGMNVLQIRAYFPGLGEIDLLDSPPLDEAQRRLECDGPYGNESLTMGCVPLLPYAGRIRGHASFDAIAIMSIIAGRKVWLPANWQAVAIGGERHSLNGLILNAKFDRLQRWDGVLESSLYGVLPAGNFGGRWCSETRATTEIRLQDHVLEIDINARNVGTETLPMGLGMHPIFTIPSGRREQARLSLPAKMRVEVNNHDDCFPAGRLRTVTHTPYDFSALTGAPVRNLALDDCFTDLRRGANRAAVIELTDPAANFGIRLSVLSEEVGAVHVTATPDKSSITICPQFNLPDPYSTLWGATDTGMVSLVPGESATYRLRMELFVLRG